MTRVSLLDRLGLHRKELRAWAMYDWANSAMVTTIVTAVFPIYFAAVAGADLGTAEATYRLAVATTIALAIIAVLAPILGTLADQAGIKKRLLGGFLLIGVVAVGLMFFIERGEWLLRRGALRGGEHRGQRQLRLLRLVPPAHRHAGGDGPGLDRGIRPGLRRRRDPPGAQSRLDPEAGMVRPAPRARSHSGPADPPYPPRLPLGRGVVAALLDTALPRCSGAGGDRGADGSR